MFGNFSKDNRGIAHLAIFIVFAAAVLGFVGYTAWNAWQANKKQDNTQVYESQKKTDEKIEEKPVATKRTALLDGKIHVVVPTGWSILDNADEYANLQRKIVIGIHKIGFQFTNEDYLKGNYGKNISVIKKTTTSKGTVIYIIKTADAYVAISSCKPTADKGCSLTLGGKLLYISLYAYRSGDQYVRELDFSTEETDRSIADFIKVAESLDI